VKVSSETIIDASADRVWEIVGHQFARIGEWATAIPASRPISQTPGAAEIPRDRVEKLLIGGDAAQTSCA
jgi:hypothetical protein